MIIDEFLSSSQDVWANPGRIAARVPRLGVLKLVLALRQGDRELLGYVVQDAASLDDVGQLVLLEAKLRQAPEAPFQGAQRALGHAVDLGVGRVEVLLRLVLRFGHWGQDAFA